LKSSNVVLLRGRDSILNGENQNDIDIYLKNKSMPIKELFGSNIVIYQKNSGPEQKKILLKCAVTNQEVEIDLFRGINWLGLPMININNVPLRFEASLSVHYLPKEIETWLMVLKNVLHNNATPNHKLQLIDKKSSFPVYAQGSAKLEKIFQDSIWAAVKNQEKNYYIYTLKARLVFIYIHMKKRPIKSILKIYSWVKLRI
jgi:hypothetical protein